jgi:hypothetical protein
MRHTAWDTMASTAGPRPANTALTATVAPHCASIADPAPVVNEFAMHDGDLTSRTAEGAQRDGEPGARRDTQWNEIAIHVTTLDSSPSGSVAG